MRYKVIMSTGEPIEIDAEEIEKVLNAANRKALVMCKQGLINPSHLVSIVPGKDPYEGSNIPRSEQEPQGPLRDYFIEARSLINSNNALPSGKRD